MNHEPEQPEDPSPAGELPQGAPPPSEPAPGTQPASEPTSESQPPSEPSAGPAPQGESPYGTPPQGESPYGTPAQGESPYGTPAQGETPYGTPPPDGTPPAAGPPGPGAAPPPPPPPHGTTGPPLAGGLQPPAAGSGGGWAFGPPPEKKKRGGKIFALVAVAVVLAGGVAFAAVRLMSSLSATPDVLSKMVPASDQGYVTAYLDPGATQKLHLRDLLGRFPAFQGKDPAKSIDELLEQALRPSGLSWVGDIKPWVGSQVAIAGKVNDQGQPDISVMIDSKDDAKALEALHRIEGLSTNQGLQWRSETYEGIEIRVGEPPGGVTPTSGFPSTAAYAVVDHVVVAATSVDRVKAAIDTDQGRTDSLADDENFKKARSALPDDVLGVAYLNLGSILDQVIPSLEAGLGFANLPPGCGTDDVGKSLDAARALRGLALSVSAESNGAALDMGFAIDRSLLPNGDQELVGAKDHQNLVLSFTPSDALGMFGFSGAQGLQAGIDQFAKCQPGVQEQLDKYGVKDILQNLSGDIGVEVHSVSSLAPEAALVAGVKDEGKMQTSLDNLVARLGQESGTSIQVTSEDYHGVAIKSVPADPTSGIAPAWAVTDGVAILATSPDEVKATLDAHGGDDVTTSSNFQAAAARVQLANQEILYVDVARVLDTVEAQTSPESLAEFRRITENVRPVKSTILTASSDGDVQRIRWFFLIP
jgi:Protein of unknown function (DUF3352)